MGFGRCASAQILFQHYLVSKATDADKRYVSTKAVFYNATPKIFLETKFARICY